MRKMEDLLGFVGGVCARVGPYLSADETAAAADVRQRLAVLDRDLEEPLLLTAPKECPAG